MTPAAASSPQSYKINGPFAPLTKVVQDVMKKLTPCAKSLWTWIRSEHRPFKIIEINIRDFSEEFDYSPRWVKQAYQELIEHGLWEESYRWPGGRDYRGMVIDPGVCDPRVAEARPAAQLKNPENDVQSSTSVRETSTTVASKLDAVYPITEDQKDLKETRTLPPPVLKKDEQGEGIDEVSKSPDRAGEKLKNLTHKTEDRKTEDRKTKDTRSQTQPPEALKPALTAPAINLEEFNPQLLVKDCPATVAQALAEKAMAELDVRITQPIFKLLQESPIGVVQNAIAAVKQRLESPTAEPVHSREGLFTTALRRRFTPNRKAQETPLRTDEGAKVAPEGFGAWYEVAYAARLVCGSTMIDGEMWLYRASDTSLVRWQDLKAEYPDLLAAKLDQQHSVQGQQRALEKLKPVQKLNPVAESRERPEFMDLSDVIAQTAIEIKRLGWQEPELRDHLSQTYGKRSRQQLRDDELLDFLDWLQAQTAKLENAFNAWTGGQPWGKPATSAPRTEVTGLRASSLS